MTKVECDRLKMVDIEERNSEEENFWNVSNSSSPEVTLPPLKCSKYNVIGEPTNRKPRRGPEIKGWRVPFLPYLQTTGQKGNNAIDNRTIYSRKQDQLYKVLADEDDGIPTPLQCSPRMAKLRPGTQHILEKSLVMKDFYATGPVRKFEQDRAVFPTVYSEFFECPRRKKNYIREMFSDDFRRRNSRNPLCSKIKYKPGEKCHFCDVIGNRYCAFCMEFKNRNFALSYEQNYLPSASL